MPGHEGNERRGWGSVRGQREAGVAQRAKLNGKAQAVRRAPMLLDYRQIRLTEGEVPDQVFLEAEPGGRVAGSHPEDTGEVQPVERLNVEALLDRLVPAAMLTKAGIPCAAAAVAPDWQTVEVRGRTFQALAYRGRLVGIGLVQLVLAEERYGDGRGSPTSR